MSIAKKRALRILVLLLSYPLPSIATTVTICITRHGIIVSSDSKSTYGTTDNPHLAQWDTQKLVLIQNHIAIAAVGFANIKLGSTQYDFLTWLKELQDGIPDNISVQEFAGIIQAKSSEVFSTFNVVLENHFMKPNNPVYSCDPFLDYVITGYQDGTPRVYVVHIYINWETLKLVGPRTVVLDPGHELKGTVRIHAFGVNDAITEVLDRDSYAYKQAMIISNKAFSDVVAHRDVTLNETISFARALIKIEENVHPRLVGGRAQIVELFPDGRTGKIVNGLSGAASAKGKNHP